MLKTKAVIITVGNRVNEKYLIGEKLINKLV
jgi:hypothetical protein